jgi:cell division protein FtsI/penicillin-binding protein 2
MSMGSRARRWTGATLAVLVVGTALTACGDQPPGPQASAKALAAAIASGSFGDVSFAGEATSAAATSDRKDAYAGLDPWTPKVTAATDQDPKDKNDATVTLSFRWDVGAGQPWTYQTHAQLARDAKDKKVWRVTWSPALLAPDLVAGEKLTDKRVAADRADVLNGGGQPLVTPRPVHTYGIDKTRVGADQQPASAQALAAIVGLDPATYAASVAKAGPKAFVPAITLRDKDPDPNPQYDTAKMVAIPGVVAVAGTKPLAPSKTFARAILGSVGDATAEIVKSSNGAIAAGDQTGLSGLQKQYDKQLRGTPGLTISAVGAAGGTGRQLFHVDPKAGTPVQTTLDENLQLAAEQVLAGTTPASALVAIRPSTGAVLAAASGPGSNGQSTATLAQAAPGSTFKVATALALLRHGATLTSSLTCPETITVAGRQFKNTPDYPASKLGTIPLTTAFAHSCNTAFISQQDQVSQQDLADAAASLGLTQTPAVGVPVVLGNVPTDSTGTDHAASMIGQARIVASPLGMATVAASVAAGHTVSPFLVVRASIAAPTATASASASTASGSASASAPATPTPAASAAPAKPLTADEAQQLQTLMAAVVTDGTATLLKDVPNGPVLAKTGTAQFGDASQNHAWLIAIRGDLAVCAYVEVGDFGATTAGPLVDAFLKAAQV